MSLSLPPHRHKDGYNVVPHQISNKYIISKQMSDGGWEAIKIAPSLGEQMGKDFLEEVTWTWVQLRGELWEEGEVWNITQAYSEASRSVLLLEGRQGEKWGWDRGRLAEPENMDCISEAWGLLRAGHGRVQALLWGMNRQSQWAGWAPRRFCNSGYEGRKKTKTKTKTQKGLQA